MIEKYTQFALRTWFFIFAFTVAYFFYTYQNLPDRFAVHFDASGHPNGWSSKSFHLYFYSALVLTTNALIFGLYRLRDIVRFNIYVKFERVKYGTPEEIKKEVVRRASLILSLVGIFLNYTFSVCTQIIAQTAQATPISISPKLMLVSIFAVAAMLVVGSMTIANPLKKL